MVKIEIDVERWSKKKTRNVTTLITLSENRKPQYVGSCKLSLDLLSQALFVKPKNENFNDITATFNWKFIRSKNILFVFAEFDFQDFALVFKNEEICIKVWNAIFKNRDVDSVAEEILQERFLNPLFKNASKNWRMKEILEEWIQKFDVKEKSEYLKLLKWHQENPENIDDEEENDIKDVKVKIEPPPEKNRKRRHHEIDKNGLQDSADFVNHNAFYSSDDDKSHESSTNYHDNFSFNRLTKIVDNSNFCLKNSGRLRRKLLIFTSTDRKECYEFTFHRNKQIFYHRCHEMLKGIKAILDLDENGNECIKMENRKHRCSPILYEPEKYSELKIVKKPDFEILENCAIQSQARRMLIIFDSNDKSQCYEYYWSLSRKKFYCRGCASKRNRGIVAEIFYESTEIEYVVLSEKEHICNKRKYNPAKYFSSNQFVTSPNFEIQTKIKNGKERKTLIIFNENDRKLCYSYYYHEHGNVFICNSCLRKKTYVFSKLCKNAENEEYVILSNSKHACSLRKYVPQNEIIILRPPKFKFMEATEKSKSKLFIFDSIDPELCYVFSQKLGRKRYHCLGCAAMVERNKRTNTNEYHQTKKTVTVFLGKDDGPNGEFFVKINGGEKHICQPKKYQPEKYELEKYERKILKPKIDYIMFREKMVNV